MKKKFYLLSLLMILGLSFGLLFSSAKSITAAEVVSDDSLEVLLSSYYGDGTYKKETIIYVDSEKVAQDLHIYFHAEVATLERTTYYSEDALWMSRGEEVAGVKYSYYGTAYDDKTPVGVTNGTAEYPLVAPEKTSIALSGENQNSMEEYYVTLHDFIEGQHTSAHTDNEVINLSEGWMVEESVYSNTNPDVLDGFRLFTAPLWLGKTSENGNYIQYTKATVQEENSQLVMKLWVSSEEVGKLVDGVEADSEGNLLFSKAVVSKKQADGLLQGKGENLQAGLGTDFEGYSPETHPEIFDSSFKFTNSGNYITNNPNLSYGTNIVKKGESKAHGIWFADNNENNALALQAGYNDMRLVQEEDGNTAVKILKGNGSLTRVGMTVNQELKNPGTYIATIKVKAGSDANNVGKILFKLYDSSNIFASGNKTDGFYFRGTSSAAPTEAMVKGEWITLSVEFTISKEISYTNDLCATFVVYNTYSSDDSYVLVDDFEVYRIEDYGTDFEGYDLETHSDLFVHPGTISTGWKTDGNGNAAFGVQKNYQGCKLFQEENGNNALIVWGSKEVVRVGIDVNDIISNPGVYKVSLKVKLGPNADNVGSILIRYHDKKGLLADNALLKTGFYFKEPTEDVGLSKDEWVTLETMIVITDKIEFSNDLCFVLMVYTYGNKTYETDAHPGNYVLVDDLQIEGYVF